MPRIGLKLALTTAAALLIGLLLTAAWFWRDDIHEARLDPGVPFQTYKPPPAPDYTSRASWVLLPPETAQAAANEPAVDVFFVHPTTFDGGRDWVGPVGDSSADRYLGKVMLPNYAGPFRTVGRMFAPRYRQASLYSLDTSRDDAREARAFAYGDVEAAFRTYLQTYNNGRPFILVGVEQGGFLAERLLIDMDPGQRRQLIAAYLIETAIPKDSPPIAPCVVRAQAHCLVSWISAIEGEHHTISDRLRHSLAWSGDQAGMLAARQPLCVNPVTGTLNGVASAKQHLGGVNASSLDWDARPAFLAHQVSAECRNNILRISRPRAPSLRSSGSWLDDVGSKPFNIFYADLEADAQARIQAAKSEPGPQPAS
jgi:hypothetical protein